MKRRYRIEGLVQGVGFRYFTVQKAKALGIQGTVSNQRDGSVAIVATGDDQSMEAFEKALRKGPRFAKVEQITSEPYAGTLPDDFQVVG